MSLENITKKNELAIDFYTDLRKMYFDAYSVERNVSKVCLPILSKAYESLEVIEEAGQNSTIIIGIPPLKPSNKGDLIEKLNTTELAITMNPHGDLTYISKY